MTPIFKDQKTENPPSAFKVVLAESSSHTNTGHLFKTVKTVTQEVHVLRQLFNTNIRGRLVVFDEDYYSREPFVIGCVEQLCGLSWKLLQPFNVFNNYMEAHGVSVTPQLEYSHVCYMSDFELEDKGRRYASVHNVMGRQYFSIVRSTGITLLPSELFARVTVDLVFCPRDTTRRLLLNPSKTYAMSITRVVRETSEGTQDTKEQEDEFKFGSAKGLSVQDMDNINWARKAVRKTCYYIVQERKLFIMHFNMDAASLMIVCLFTN